MGKNLPHGTVTVTSNVHQIGLAYGMPRLANWFMSPTRPSSFVLLLIKTRNGVVIEKATFIIFYSCYRPDTPTNNEDNCELLVFRKAHQGSSIVNLRPSDDSFTMAAAQM